ncbi:MAG TPA: hypothetical protein VI072_11620 [Polyangiaceae bacterium]
MRRLSSLGQLALAASAASACVALTLPAFASNPLEYPDNGAAAFSRGGAWLATATDPLAAHYNPAAMVTQGNGVSLDFLFAYNRVCYSRRNPGNQYTGPMQSTAPDTGAAARYSPVCNEQTYQPRIIPSLGIVWRAADRLAFGFAVVAPATYGSTPGEWPSVTEGKFGNGERTTVPAPYRFMSVGNRSTILHPTLSVGYELAKGLRIGAGFIWSVAVIDVQSFGMRTVYADDRGDKSDVDSYSHLRTKDMFVPGAVAAIHWSATENFDAAIWGRWIDAIDSENGSLDLLGEYYNTSQTTTNPVCLDQPQNCPTSGQAIRTHFGDDPDVFKQFRFVATPPEVRAGIRFHMPRGNAPAVAATTRTIRDPLKDDLWDVELNGSYTLNSVADEIRVRFQGSPDGKAIHQVYPNGRLPPRADRFTGYKNSYGVRLGGQYNLVPEMFGVRAGGWYETAAADPEWLHIAPVPAARGGFGGGVVYRVGAFDFSVGYQRHLSRPLDNKGRGALQVGAGTWQGDPEFSTQDPPPGQSKEQQFRTFHAVNGGKVIQSAHVFTAGGVFRF